MQSTTTQAAPAAAAIAPDTLSSLYIADATLRRLCDHLSRMVHPLPDMDTPLSMHQLLLTLEDTSERLATAVNELMQEGQS